MRPYIGQVVREYTGHLDHFRKCKECGWGFDAKINLLTGEHMVQGRPASYCSDTCQNTAEKRRHRERQ